MKDLFDKAMEITKSKAPKYKTVTKCSSSIQDLTITELKEFIDDKNIPDDAVICGTDNGYDGYDDVVLSWYETVATNDYDREKFIERNFHRYVFPMVCEYFFGKGYKRVGFTSKNLKSFGTPYQMYSNGDYDLLEKFYSLYFNDTKSF